MPTTSRRWRRLYGRARVFMAAAPRCRRPRGTSCRCACRRPARCGWPRTTSTARAAAARTRYSARRARAPAPTARCTPGGAGAAPRRRRSRRRSARAIAAPAAARAASYGHLRELLGDAHVQQRRHERLRLGHPPVAGRRLRLRRDEALHDAVFQRMEADHREPAAGLEPGAGGVEAALEVLELAVDEDADRLEAAPR